MSKITAESLLNKKPNLNKIIPTNDIDLESVSIDDLSLKKDKSNYKQYINLKSLLDSVSSCQVSDAYNTVYRESGVIRELKPVNNLKVYGKIITCETDSNDWGTSALVMDKADSGDILFIKSSDTDKAIWGELASTCAKSKGIKAVSIYGSARDYDALLYFDLPIFACDHVPNAGTALGQGKIDVDLDFDGYHIKSGDFFIGDENGVVIIPQELFNQVMVATLDVKIKESNIISLINEGLSLSEIAGLKK